jgi:fermentation-respiration switch protein FrsA (DUF1100 family)
MSQLTGWQPALDHMTDKQPGLIAKNMRECQIVAAAYTGIGADEVLYGLGGGATLGAVAGLGIASAPGTAIGSALGGMSALFNSGEIYRQVFSNCLRGRGHLPLN